MTQRITISRPVQVRARVTEELRKQLASEVQDALKRTEAEIQQIDMQAKRLQEAEKAGAPHAVVLRQHFETERQKRVERKGALVEKLKEIARLEPGSEVVQGTVEGIATVAVGDRWEDVTQGSIIIENGVVVEIRCQTNRENS